MIKKTYCITGFDCPSCASKSEAHLNEHDYIETAVIDFNNDKLHITFKEKELTIDKIKEVIKEVEDDPIEICENSEEKKKTTFFEKETIITLAKILVNVIVIILSFTVLKAEQYFWVNFGLYAFALLLISYDVYFAVIKHIIHWDDVLDEKLLMTLTSVGAFVLASVNQEVHIYFEAVMVMILFQIGEMIEGYATKKSKDAISKAVSLRVETANKVVDGNVVTVKPEELNVGDIVVVSVGEQIPVDGMIVEGNGEIDTSSLTGEFLPIQSKLDLEVFAGFIIKSGSIKVKVTRTYENSALSKVVELISNSGDKKSKADRFVDKFAKVYTPIILGVSVITMLVGGFITSNWNEWISLGLKMLVVGCPCAVVLSVPLAYFSALGLASKHGVVIKGTNYLDKLNELKKLVTDKTGTLTRGTFEITNTYAVNGNKEELMEYLVAAEYLSTHPIAVAICKDQKKDNIAKETSDYQEISGQGVSIKYRGHVVLAGNAKLMRNNNVEFIETNEYGSVVYVAVDNKYIGYVNLNDVVKKEAKEMVSLMKKENIDVVMLTGDKDSNASKLASELGIGRYHAELLPEDKTSYLEKELSPKYATAFVGDGINDAACIKEADIGIAMGAIGSDVAIESADVIIMNDDPLRINDAHKIAKIARRVSLFNIIFSISVKVAIEVAALITSVLGVADVIPMWLAVAADTGLMVLMVINSVSILYRKNICKSV